MSESKFKNLQEDVCYKEPEQVAEEEALDKICPTCIPNPSFVEPDWTQTEEPYLNEATCEYQVKAIINFDADIYYDKNTRFVASSEISETLAGAEKDRRSFRRIFDSPYKPNALLKSYIRPAVRKILRHFGKLETDKIVCASPPQGPGQICKGIFGLDYDKHLRLSELSTDELVPSTFYVQEVDEEAMLSEFEDITNPSALEIYARVKDYSFVTNMNVLVVHIAVPAYKFDSIPDAPDLGSLNTSTDQIVIKPPEFMDTIDKFQKAMTAFQKFQSYFYKQENGSVYYEKTGDPFYVRFYARERIDKFVDSLNTLLEKNNFNLKGALNTGTNHPNIAHEIEISFDKTDESKPFVVKNVRARKKNCPYVECKTGLPTFIKHSENDQTMMGYISDIEDIGSQLQNNKTPPWIDFLVSKTFPQLAVNYGSSENFEDNACLSVNLQQAYDFILEESMDLFTAIEYRFNQNQCKSSADILAARSEITDIFSGSPESIKLREELATAWKTREEQGKAVLKAGKAGVKGAVQLFSDPGKALSEMGSSIAAGAISTTEAITQFVLNFNPCDFSKSMVIAMKCLSAGLTLDEVYYTILKQIIKASGEQAILTILESLPANKRQEIEEKIRQEFKDMPFPWEPGWESGSLGKAVDRQARENASDNQEKEAYATGEASSLRERIRKLKEDLESIEIVLNKPFAAIIDEDFENILKQIDEKRIENTALDIEVKRANDEIERLESFLKPFQDPAGLNDDQLAVWLEEQQSNEAFKKLIEKEKELRDNKLEQMALNTKSIKENLKFVDDDGVTRIPSKAYNDFLKKEQKRIKKLIEKLEKKKFKEETTAEELQVYKDFQGLSAAGQQEVIEKQKEKTRIVRTTPSDRIVQGTLGKALGNVQEAISQMFIDEIMKTASIVELQRAYENIPGADVLGKLISRFKCGTDPLFYPPFESFLSTLTFDPCGTEKTRLSLPTIQEIPFKFNIYEQLTDAFYIALREVASRALMAIIAKATQLLNVDLCKVAGNLTRAGIEGGLEGVIDDILCPDLDTNVPDESVSKRQERLNKIEDQKRKEKTHKSLLSAGGAGGRSAKSNSSLVKLLSVTATQGEIKQAMIGKADAKFLSNISFVVKSALPEFSDVFSDRQSTAQFFSQMGNILTPEQRSAMIEEEEAPFDQFPVENSICLTKEEKDAWDIQRRSAFSDPEMGREFVAKQDEKAKSDLADAVDLLINGPDQALQNAINDAFNPKDPDCKQNKGVVPTYNDFPQSEKETISNAITGIFKTLERAFLNDTIEGNAFGSFFGADTAGVLIEILSNTRGLHLANHMLARNNFFFQFIFRQLGQPFEFPETVAINLKKNIASELLQVTKYKYLAGSDFKIAFSNGKTKKDKFNSEISFNDSKEPRGEIIFKDSWSSTSFTSDNFLEVPVEYEPDAYDVLDFDTPFGAMTLGKLVEKKWKDFSLSFEKKDFISIYEGMQNIILEQLPGRFVERQVGQISEGFLFGNEDQPILEDSDLVYVNPEPGSTEYTYEEEDAVLGRSLTNNPRVFFLDPNKHGGTYLAPNIYIAEASHKGWLNFSKIVVPNPTGCDPKNSNFLMLDKIVEQINENKSKIKSHENLQYDPQCTIELPFDKVSNSDTLATLEGIVRATIRIHLSDFLIRSFPIFSNIHLDIERNYDNILLNYITEKIYNSLLNERSVFASTYEGYTYSLLFLEQIVQIVSRRVKDGDMETNEEIDEIIATCTDVQENFPFILRKDVNYLIKVKNRNTLLERKQRNGSLAKAQQKELDKFEDELNALPSEYLDLLESLVTQIEAGTAILSGVRDEGFDLFSFFESLFLEIALMTLEQMRFAVKINAIHGVVSDIKKLLKYIVKEELDIYTKKMIDQLEPRPWIYDINKFFIGGSKIMLGKQIEAGVFDAEIPIGGGESSLPYGDINDCPKRGMTHPLSGMQILSETYFDLEKKGGFYLEKYIVADPKKQSRLVNVQPNQFSPGGKGVLTISEFKQFLSQNSSVFTSTDNVSDYFGDAVLAEDENSYEGSIGVKFGVRLCYIPPKDFNGPTVDAITKEIAKRSRSFILEPASFSIEGNYEKTLESSRFSFPICHYEQDISDVKILDLIDSNKNLNQDLKCYIDKLAETEDYKHLVDNVLQIKKIPSMYMVYSYINLIPSLGESTEREENSDDVPISPSNLGKIFNNSKAEARKLFVSYYKNNDRDPPNEEESSEDLIQATQRKLLNQLNFVDLGEFSWDIRRRIKTESPHDKDGNECKNNFGKLFTLKGG